LKKKDSVTPPDLMAVTERKNNFSKTMDLGAITGLPNERSPVFNTTRRSISKCPVTLEEAQVPLNSAKRAMRKMDKSLDSQIAGQFVDQIENRKKEVAGPVQEM
jgi:hypothetical protein